MTHVGLRGDIPVENVQHDAGGYLDGWVSIIVVNREDPELRCVRLKIFYQNITPCKNWESPQKTQEKGNTKCEPECKRMHSGERKPICFRFQFFACFLG